MSRKHPQTRSGQIHPQPSNDSGTSKERNASARVDVHGEIKVDFDPEIKKADAAKEKKDDSREKAKRILESCTLLAVLFYSGLTFWQGCMTRTLVTTAQDTFEASNRPYIGLVDLTAFHYWKDTNGNMVKEQSRTTKTTDMVIVGDVKNFGTVPANDLLLTWEITENGVNVVKGQPSPTSILFPSAVAMLNAQVGGPPYQALVSGRDVLRFQIRASYRGPRGAYTYCEREQYYARNNSFANLGNACDGPWDTPIGKPDIVVPRRQD